MRLQDAYDSKLDCDSMLSKEPLGLADARFSSVEHSG